VRFRNAALFVVCIFVSSAALAASLTQRNLVEMRDRMRDGETDIEIAEPISLTQDETWDVEDVTFTGRGVIYLREFDLDLTVRHDLKVRNSTGPVFVSFPQDEWRAPNGSGGQSGQKPEASGAPGARGYDGKSAGNLTIRAFDAVEGRVLVTLNGQNGGYGGPGGNGAPGPSGIPGKAGKPGVFNCIQRATPPTAGGRGGNGGRGGDGGSCGQGGVLRVYYRRKTPPPIELAGVARAANGNAGSGGTGGPGGAGGAGAQGGSFCPGTSAGKPGPNGLRGSDGVSPKATCDPPRAEAPVRIAPAAKK
jgi:hypothetical protein